MESKEAIQDRIEEQARLFSALANPTRLKLINLLYRQCYPDALCVNALAGFLRVTQSAVSQHLRILKSIGLVKGERRGYHIHYFVNREALEHCQNLASAVLTIGEPGKEADTCEKYCPIRREQNVSYK